MYLRRRVLDSAPSKSEIPDFSVDHFLGLLGAEVGGGRENLAVPCLCHHTNMDHCLRLIGCSCQPAVNHEGEVGLRVGTSGSLHLVLLYGGGLCVVFTVPLDPRTSFHKAQEGGVEGWRTRGAQDEQGLVHMRRRGGCHCFGGALGPAGGLP